MKLLLDEMHSPRIADVLVDSSRDVVAVAAEIDLRGVSDEDVFAYAVASERALITENVIDYAPLAERWTGEGRTHAGLVFTNPKRFNRAAIAYPGDLVSGLEQFLDDPPIEGRSWIWWL